MNGCKGHSLIIPTFLKRKVRSCWGYGDPLACGPSIPLWQVQTPSGEAPGRLSSSPRNNADNQPKPLVMTGSQPDYDCAASYR